MTFEESIVKVLEQTREEIRANMAAKDINASGRTSRAFAVETYQGGVRLVLKHDTRTAPLETLEVGRPGGNVPGGFRMTKAGVMDVSNKFKFMLVKWAEEKGIADFGWGAATMLGRRIAKEGTLRNTQHEDVYSTPVQKAVQGIRADIRGIVLGEIKQAKNNFNNGK